MTIPDTPRINISTDIHNQTPVCRGRDHMNYRYRGGGGQYGGQR